MADFNGCAEGHIYDTADDFIKAAARAKRRAKHNQVVMLCAIGMDSICYRASGLQLVTLIVNGKIVDIPKDVVNTNDFFDYVRQGILSVTQAKTLEVSQPQTVFGMPMPT